MLHAPILPSQPAARPALGAVRSAGRLSRNGRRPAGRSRMRAAGAAGHAQARPTSGLTSWPLPAGPVQLSCLPADSRSSQASTTRAAMPASPALPQERGS